MPAYNFQTRFAAKVESGEKCQTIRRRRKRPTKAGEMLYLYTDQRTKNPRKLREAKCVRVSAVEIHLNEVRSQNAMLAGLVCHYAYVKVDGFRLSSSELDAFVQADGFVSLTDFTEFWRDVHGLTPDNPLKGFELIQWEQKP